MKRKTDDDDDIDKEEPSKHPRLEEKEVNGKNKEEIEIIDEHCAKQRAKNKAKISSIVMSLLNRKYSKKKIAGPDPKALFKFMARKITHVFYDPNPELRPNPKQIERFIEKIFEEHEIVTSEQQLDDI